MSKPWVIIFPSLEILFLPLKQSKRNKNILSGVIQSHCPSSITPLNSHPHTVTKKKKSYTSGVNFRLTLRSLIQPMDMREKAKKILKLPNKTPIILFLNITIFCLITSCAEEDSSQICFFQSHWQFHLLLAQE